MLFRVRWEIDIDAETKEAAALAALERQRQTDSTSVIFDVREADKSEDDFDIIDLIDHTR